MDKGKREERRYRAIFENMRNGVAVYQPVDDGRDFVFIDFNKAAERLDGVRKSDLIGKRLLDVFPNADKFGVLASLQRTHRTGEPEYLPASYYRDEHSEGWRENFICKLPDGDIVAIYDDITDHKRFEENIVEREGTTVRVLFPPSEQIEAPSVKVNGQVETPLSVPVISTGPKTVLVVDDEDLVRGMVLNRLKVLGYDTIAASDGEEGVRVFRAGSNEIDLVLLDFAMPRMNGIEAFGELIRIKPDVKVILTSGYTEAVVMRSFPGQRPAGVLHKPYKMVALKAELDRLLGSTN
jgi:PAS domain S-box-containing protein